MEGRFEESYFVPHNIGERGEPKYLPVNDPEVTSIGKARSQIDHSVEKKWTDRVNKGAWKIVCKGYEIPRSAILSRFMFDIEGKSIVFWGISYCSGKKDRIETMDQVFEIPSESFDMKRGVKIARGRAIKQLKRHFGDDGWKIAIKCGVIKGHIPKDKEEVKERRIKRNDDRKKSKQASQVRAFVKQFEALNDPDVREKVVNEIVHLVNVDFVKEVQSR